MCEKIEKEEIKKEEIKKENMKLLSSKFIIIEETWKSLRDILTWDPIHDILNSDTNLIRTWFMKSWLIMEERFVKEVPKVFFDKDNKWNIFANTVFNNDDFFDNMSSFWELKFFKNKMTKKEFDRIINNVLYNHKDTREYDIETIKKIAAKKNEYKINILYEFYISNNYDSSNVWLEKRKVILAWMFSNILKEIPTSKNSE